MPYRTCGPICILDNVEVMADAIPVSELRQGWYFHHFLLYLQRGLVNGFSVLAASKITFMPTPRAFTSCRKSAESGNTILSTAFAPDFYGQDCWAWVRRDPGGLSVWYSGQPILGSLSWNFGNIRSHDARKHRKIAELPGFRWRNG